MDKEATDKLVQILSDAPSIYDSPPTIQKGASAFQNSTIGDNIYDCRKGFGREYGKPASKGGRYMTLTDLRMMYYLGVEGGKQMLNGWKPFYDEQFCRSIGGYPKGAIIRYPDGRKMVSRIENNLQPLPEKYETNRYWAVVRPMQTWRNHTGDGSDDLVYPPLNFIPPQEKTTAVYCIPADFMYSALYHIPLYFYVPIKREDSPGSWWFLESTLCTVGEFELRMSRYDDIYTNKNHSNNYITIGKIMPLRVNQYMSRNGEAISRLIPISAGRWYFYFDYKDGCTSIRSPYGGYNNDFRLVVHPYYRTLIWPHY